MSTNIEVQKHDVMLSETQFLLFQQHEQYIHFTTEYENNFIQQLYSILTGSVDANFANYPTGVRRLLVYC